MEVGRSFTYIVLGGVELCCCQLEVSLGRIVLSSWVALGSCLQHKWEQYQGLEVVLHGIEDGGDLEFKKIKKKKILL